MALPKTCTASQLINELQKFIDQYGDLPVYADDPCTGYRMNIGLVRRPENKNEECPDRLEIKTDYADNPKGVWY